ncbi:MAG: hypothetical protein GC136_08430 [Alphaproteobacteria bacterium]|nr:hypothetical protein [Alphaproteobacteria bacterium]
MEADLQAIKERNARVEADKAWETSFVRRGFIAFVTYIVAATYMEVVGLGNALAGACVPTGGYLLSTFSLPPLKKLWIEKFYKTGIKV